MERSIVTRHQMHVMVSYIEKNPMMVTGRCTENFTTIDKKRMWEELSKRLNAEGPCKKSVDKWIRSWVDLKSNVKRKASEIKKGLPHSHKTLNPLEKRVITLIRLADARQIKKAGGAGEYRQQIDIFKKAEDQLKKSNSKFSFSGSLLPAMPNPELKELMQRNSELRPLVDEAYNSDVVSSKEVPISAGAASLFENKCPENDPIPESSSLSLFGEPMDTKESIKDENILEMEVIVKQEPPDEISYETSSSALEPQNPVIVSVAPVLTTRVRPFPILPDYRETVRLQSILNDSPTLPLPTDDLPPNVIDTADESNPEISASDSVNITATEEDPQLQDCDHNTDTNLLLSTPTDKEFQLQDCDRNTDPNLLLSTQAEKESQLKGCDHNTDPNLLITEGRRDYFKANKTKQSIAIKAASALTSMAERNCTVLERIANAIEIQAVQSVKIATALEVQATQSVKQTQLIDQLLKILSKK